MLIAQRRDRLSFTETIAAIRQFTRELNERFPERSGHAILIEKSANGPAVIDALRGRLSGVIPAVPEGSKVERAHAMSPLVEAGNFYLPGAPNADRTSYDRTRTPAWVQAFIEEAAAFPHSTHDDQVDAMTQAAKRLNRPRPRIRRLTPPRTGGRLGRRRAGYWRGA